MMGGGQHHHLGRTHARVMADIWIIFILISAVINMFDVYRLVSDRVPFHIDTFVNLLLQLSKYKTCYHDLLDHQLSPLPLVGFVGWFGQALKQAETSCFINLLVKCKETQQIPQYSVCPWQRLSTKRVTSSKYGFLSDIIMSHPLFLHNTWSIRNYVLNKRPLIYKKIEELQYLMKVFTSLAPGQFVGPVPATISISLGLEAMRPGHWTPAHCPGRSKTNMEYYNLNCNKLNRTGLKTPLDSIHPLLKKHFCFFSGSRC